MYIYKIAKQHKTGTISKIRFVYASSKKEAETIYRDLCNEPDTKLKIEQQVQSGMVLSHRDTPWTLRDQIMIY